MKYRKKHGIPPLNPYSQGGASRRSGQEDAQKSDAPAIDFQETTLSSFVTDLSTGKDILDSLNGLPSGMWGLMASDSILEYGSESDLRTHIMNLLRDCTKDLSFQAEITIFSELYMANERADILVLWQQSEGLPRIPILVVEVRKPG